MPIALLETPGAAAAAAPGEHQCLDGVWASLYRSENYPSIIFSALLRFHHAKSYLKKVVIMFDLLHFMKKV